MYNAGLNVYTTFDMIVSSEWIPISDRSVFKQLKASVIAAEASLDKREQLLASLHKKLASDLDPIFCMGVNYIIPTMHLKNVEGQNLKTQPSGIKPVDIGQDVHLKEVLKNQQKNKS